MNVGKLIASWPVLRQLDGDAVRCRRVYGRDWEELSLDEMDMIPDLVLATREATWEEDAGGVPATDGAAVAAITPTERTGPVRRFARLGADRR